MTRRALVAATCTATLTVGMAGGAWAADRQVEVDTAPASEANSSESVEHAFHDGDTSGGHVTTHGKRLYVGAYGLGFRIFDISDPLAPEEIGSYLPGGRADAVPDATEWDGRHIATLGGTRRAQSRDTPIGTVEGTDTTEFLDVTDPQDPQVLWKFTGQEHGEAHNGDIVDDRRLWLPSGGRGDNGLRIYDMNPLLGDEAEAPERLLNADPVQLWEDSPFRDGRDVGPDFSHTHDISVYTDYELQQPDGSRDERDILLLAEGGGYGDDGPDYGREHGNTGSVFVIDITDPREPLVLQRWRHGHGEGHHPIRYVHEAQFLDGDERLMLVTDEDMHHPCGEGDDSAVDTAGGGVVAVRLADMLTSATEESEWFIPEGTPAPVCSVHVMSSKNGYLFLGSYNAGLQVVDYSDSENPRQAGFGIQPGSTAWGAEVGKHGTVYVGDMTRGLDVFVFDPLVPPGQQKRR